MCVKFLRYLDKIVFFRHLSENVAEYNSKVNKKTNPDDIIHRDGGRFYINDGGKGKCKVV